MKTMFEFLVLKKKFQNLILRVLKVKFHEEKTGNHTFKSTVEFLEKLTQEKIWLIKL